MEIEGIVVSGLGRAKHFINMMKEPFLKKYNKQLFEGTLNIKLNKELSLITQDIIENYEYGGTQNVLIQKCKIFNEEVFIVRAEKNNKPGGDYNLNIIEIVAEEKLRDKYNIKDGDKIIITIQTF